MARASSLYTVFHNGPNGLKPLAGFTVRHELVTWLRGQLPEYLDLMTVFKFPDGYRMNYSTNLPYGFEPFEMDIVELLK